jgi:HPt (histidine-containing phosphotransfer) domain-containing protein
LSGADLSALACPAHALKGASRTIGARQLADACEALELAARRADLEAARAAVGRAGDAWDELRPALENILVVEIQQ